MNFHLLLGHIVADHAFTNNYKIRTYKGWRLLGHMAWSVFALLAFTFDVLLYDPFGLIVLLSFSVLHILGDWFRTVLYSKNKKRALDMLELTMVVAAFVANTLVEKLFDRSYLSSEFVYYLLGMSVVSTGVTYFFRNFHPGVEDMSDIEGISERLAFFVFLLAGKPLFAFLSLLLGFLYRLWKIRRFDSTWWLSPLLGVVITYFWKFTLYGVS